MKYTKGPWVFGRSDHAERGFYINANSGHLGYVQGEEDARLIAAAPDLLEAAKAFLAQNDAGDDVSRGMRAAIDKAEGNEK